jgi:N-acetylglucosaminyldiphosphoundecaprenol N-acetyl-beta-D-mannosaminyltransferase
VTGAKRRTVEVLGNAIDALDMDETVARCLELVGVPGTSVQVSVNAAKLVSCDRDPAMASFVREADLVNADGQSVVWAARLLGRPLPCRVAGIDLMHHLLAAAEENELVIFVLGARPETLERALEAIRMTHPRLRIAGAQHGYYAFNEEPAVVEGIAASGADLLFVAMSSPRKEEFLGRNRESLGVRFAMGVGGAVDVLAGETRRAYIWMQRAGLEWLYRCAQEPRRMWRRYLVGNTRFVLLVIRALIRGERGRPPARG